MTPAPDTLRHLEAFALRYAELAELVTDAARYGNNEVLEERYWRLRAWMQAHYRTVKATLQAVLPAPEDRRLAQRWNEERRDSFERLFAAPTLEALLDQNGHQLGRLLEQTQSALALSTRQAAGVA